MKTVGIVGCGAIGSALAGYIKKELSGYVGDILLFDVDKEKAESLQGKVSISKTSDSLDNLTENSDLIIESAVGSVVPELLNKVIEKGKDLMVMSIGGLLGSEELFKEAEEKEIRVLLPSGAIAGIDALKAAKIAGLESVTLTTRKSPKSIKGAPYLDEKGIDVESIKEETIVFEGSALEAVKAFPKNVNVSALLSITGIGAQDTSVKIVVCPELKRNVHEIEIKGSSGIVNIRAENVPFPENPKTSYLAALAAMASVKGYFETVRLGT